MCVSAKRPAWAQRHPPVFQWPATSFVLQPSSSSTALFSWSVRRADSPDAGDSIPEQLSILCGLAVGYPDPDFAANKLNIGREPIKENVVFLDS